MEFYNILEKEVYDLVCFNNTSSPKIQRFQLHCSKYIYNQLMGELNAPQKWGNVQGPVGQFKYFKIQYPFGASLTIIAEHRSGYNIIKIAGE